MSEQSDAQPETTHPDEPLSRSASRTSRDSALKKFALRFEMPLLIALAIAIAIVLKTFVIQPFYIPSPSMERTLHGPGDRILVFKPIFELRDPHPGDIVVFKAPPDWEEGSTSTAAQNPIVHGIRWFGQLVGIVPPNEKDLVKRVIAVGGQTVKCCDDRGNVEISSSGPDGPWHSLNEPYIYEPKQWFPRQADGEKAPGDARSFGPVTVPAGRLWVLGDHRSDSADSTYHCGDLGADSKCDPVESTVPVSNVIGKAVVIAWPPSRWRTLGTPPTFKALASTTTAVTVALPVVLSVLVVAGGLFTWQYLRRRRSRPRARHR